MLEGMVARRCAAEFIGTFGLVFAGPGAIVINELSDERVTHVGIGLTFGLIVAAMVYATGHISGASLNPSRSFGPALVSGTWDDHRVYWVSPMIGAAIAPLSYAWLGRQDHDASTEKV